jgi:hypothetical protein
MRFSHSDLAGMLRSKPAPVSARARAEAQAQKIRSLISMHGHLKTEHIAAHCWPSRYFTQGLQMTQRALAREAALGNIKSRTNAHGTRSWILTRAGAMTVGAGHGYALACSGSSFSHHSLTSRFIIHKEVSEGFTVWHEHALTHGKSPITGQQLCRAYGKQPDAILIAPDNRFYWVETEISAGKAYSTLQAIAGLAAYCDGRRVDPSLPYTFSGLYLVFDEAMEWHATRLAHCARMRWSQLGIAANTLASRIVLARISVGPQWGWRGCRESCISL